MTKITLNSPKRILFVVSLLLLHLSSTPSWYSLARWSAAKPSIVATAPLLTAMARPACDTYTNRTTANGLGNNNVVGGVYVVGSTVYAGTQGGLSISTDGGATFTNRTTDRQRAGQ